MNRKDIVDCLGNIGPSQFQKLGDNLLPIYKSKYKDLISKGNHIYEDKTIKGTPDSYKYIKDHIIAVQYTVSKNDIKKKLLEDIDKIIKWDLFSSVNEIVLVSNSRASDDAEKACREKLIGFKTNINLQIIWIDNILRIVEENYDAKVIMSEFSEINFVEISLKQDFRRYYWNTYYKNKKDILLSYRDTTLDQYGLYINVFDDNRNKKTHRSLAISNRAIIFGKPGSGKSLILRQIFLHSFHRCNDYSVFVDLSTYMQQDIINLLKRNLECNGIRISSNLIEQYLCEGKLFIIFDGFDELDTQARKKIINDFFRDSRFRRNRFLISSRYNIDEIKLIENCNIYHVSDLSKKKAYKKVLKRLITKEDCLKLREYLKAHNLESFLSNPLNLSFLINILVRNEYLDVKKIISDLKNEILLYSSYINKLIEWEIKKSFYVDISAKHVENITSYIAYYMTENCILQITEESIEDIINKMVKNKYLDYKTRDIKNILINTVYHSYGNKIKFNHKNLKVFLTYKYIDEKLDWWSLISNPLFNDVIVWASLADNNFFIRHIQQISNENLIKILSEIENEKINIFLKYIQNFFNLELEDNLKNKLNIIFQRFRYDEQVLDITFKYLKALSNNKENFDDLLDSNSSIKYICNRENAYYNFGVVISRYFSGKYCKYDILNKRWIEEGKNNRLIKIISFYMLRQIMNSQEYNNDIFEIYSEAFKSNDEELVYNALLSVKNYIFIDDTFSIFNVIGTSPKGKELIALFESLNRSISKRVEVLSDEIDTQIQINSKHGIRELFARIKEYKMTNDYNIGLDFAKSNEAIYFRDEIIDVLGKKQISELLIYSLRYKAHRTEDIIQMLDCIYYYYLTDKNVMVEVLNLLSSNYYNSFDENDIKTECLKVVCGRISENKLKVICEFYEKEQCINKNKVLLLWAMWIIINAYPEILSSKYNAYVIKFKDEIDNFKCYTSLNLKEFLNLSTELWNLNVYIKDYDNDSARWGHIYRNFFYYMIDKIDKRLIFELCFEFESDYGKYEQIVVDLIKVIKDTKWLKILQEKNKLCWDERASEILDEWNDE